MTTRKNLDRSNASGAKRAGGGPVRLRFVWALPAVAVAAAAVAAYGSPAASSPASAMSTVSTVAAMKTSPTMIKTAKIGGTTVLTNAKGLTLYWFAPDTPTMSHCNGACAQTWPPLKGPATASGVKGTFSTIKRSDGSIQATFNGHPLYTFVGDSAPKQANGNGLNVNGGVWHEVTTSSSAHHGGGSSSGSGAGSGY